MKNAALLASVLSLTLIASSCQQRTGKKAVTTAQPPAQPTSDVLTLSPSQLILLDWDGPYASHPKVVDRRVVNNSAAEFDIRFPGNQPGNCTIEVVSSGEGGTGRLVGMDVSAFKTFALKFTLVSINGTPASQTKQKLDVAALIGPTIDGKVAAYEPVTLSGAQGRATAISTTPVARSTIYRIGIYANLVEPEDWDPSGSTVTIRIEPVPNASMPILP